ncbi:glycosyltransferase [Devosia sp. CN2-171]|uniref:glycosyltransferase n=1 Tax=Devosia sp. CN2-171 TaxID=3400909 RepID=UPI003BF8010C
MKICLIGKYPPIVGQVSTVGFWLTEGLIGRGHSVTVCTNATEADAPFRSIVIDETSTGDPTGSALIVLGTDRFDPSQFHIPPDNPVVTKLTSLGLRAVHEHGCQIILATYLEPYGVAAHLVSAWTGVPHVQTHAGSDVGRLAAHKQLRPAYVELVARAQQFIAKSSLARGLRSDATATLPAPYAPPDSVFNPDVAPLDINAILGRASRTIGDELGWHTNPFVPDRPTIGFYGKLFEAKGVFELVKALGRVKQQGHEFNLLLMTRWYRGEELLRAAIRTEGIEDSTWLMPPVHNRHIGSFIRACDAVAYLKRDFKTPQHVSIVPDEVLSCGVCLVTTAEVAATPRYRNILRNGDTCLIVEDPRNLEDLVLRLSLVIENTGMRTAVAAAGHQALKSVRSYEEFVGSWERLLQNAIAQ